MGNERLRTAMAKARVDIEAVTNKTGVDPKTVQRWLDGRVPYARHRWAISALVSEDETYLWPETTNAKRSAEASKAELVELYPFRSAVPASLWWDLFSRAEQQIGVLVYAANFLHEQYPDLNGLLREKAAAGCKVQVALGDPDSEAVGSSPRRRGTLRPRYRDPLSGGLAALSAAHRSPGHRDPPAPDHPLQLDLPSRRRPPGQRPRVGCERLQRARHASAAAGSG
jgi:hypothetical protein